MIAGVCLSVDWRVADSLYSNNSNIAVEEETGKYRIIDGMGKPILKRAAVGLSPTLRTVGLPLVLPSPSRSSAEALHPRIACADVERTIDGGTPDDS
jgi:hypothetical protein